MKKDFEQVRHNTLKRYKENQGQQKQRLTRGQHQEDLRQHLGLLLLLELRQKTTYHAHREFSYFGREIFSKGVEKLNSAHYRRLS